MEGPRSNRDSMVVSEKLRRLQQDHVAPITRLVEQLRDTRRHKSIPYVDPTFGGVHARVMFLLETPARPAALGSTMLSPDNDDGTAENLWKLYQGSGLPRDTAVHWNAVPWFMGDAKKNKNAGRSDIVDGLPWLGRMVGLLPDLRLVVTMGDIARRSFALYLLKPEARLIPWMAVAHPSGRVRSAHPELWKDIGAVFVKAAEIAHDERS